MHVRAFLAEIWEDPATYSKLGTAGVRGSPLLRELGTALEEGSSNDWTDKRCRRR